LPCCFMPLTTFFCPTQTSVPPFCVCAKSTRKRAAPPRTPCTPISLALSLTHTCKRTPRTHPGPRQEKETTPKPEAALAVPAPLAMPAPLDGSVQSVRFIKKGLPAAVEAELVRTAEAKGMKTVRER
jgi:hypothetical protein